MMNNHHKLAAKIKELALFCLTRRGACFKGVDAAKLFRYVAFHLLLGSLFVDRDVNGVKMMVFVWRGWAADIQRRAAEDLPQFEWKLPTNEGDSLFIAEVIGNRRSMAHILKLVKAHWPESPGFRLFTYRRHGLAELSWNTVLRFSHELA